MKYWLFNRDPYSGLLLQSLHKWAVKSPIIPLTIWIFCIAHVYPSKHPMVCKLFNVEKSMLHGVHGPDILWRIFFNHPAFWVSNLIMFKENLQKA